MTAAERKKLEEEAIKRQKSTSPASAFRKKMEDEALKKQKELAARKVGTDYPATIADERTEAPTSIIGRINADIAKGREAEQTKQTLIQREKAEQDKAVRQSNAPKLSDINRSAAPVDYTKESAEAKNRFTAENPTLGMSPLEKLEYNARKYNPLALGDMAINQAAAGAGRFAASVSDAVIAPFKGKGIVYPALQTTQELWNNDKGKEPSALDKYIGNAKATLRTFQNAGRDYYLGGGTLQDKADKYSLEMSERYADITDNAVTRAMSDLAQSAGYMIPAQLANAIIPNAGTALLFVSGYSSGERQALQEGATPQDARNYALLNGLNQSAGEMLIGGVLGQGAGVLDGLLKKAGLDVASKITDPKLLRLAKGLTSALGEGAEEVIQGLIDVQAKRMTYDKGAKADPAGLAYEGLLGSLLGAGSSASAAILNAQNGTMSLPSPLPITEKKNAANTPNIDADISAKQAELSARLKTADEEALYRRLTAAKTDTEKSGILAGASDEAVAAAARFADKGGMEIAFIREDAANGVVKDGFTKGGKIYINAASDKTAATIITHELLHNLEQTDGYAAFKDYVGKHVNLTADAEELASLYRRGGLELTPTEIESEALAKYAEKLFESEDDIYNLVRTDRTLGQKILDWINNVITKLTGTAEEKYLLRAKELYSRALAEARRSGAVAGKAAASVSADDIRSDNFKRWFGDWENDPDNASKVVDKDGIPLRVFHGTNKEFNTFQSKTGAYWFSEAADYAEEMAHERKGNVVKQVYLDLKNPYYAKLPPGKFTDPSYENPIIKQAKQNGNDGVTFTVDTDDEILKDTFYVVFSPTQIKSATDNVGTYDPGNADIRYSISDSGAGKKDPTKEKLLRDYNSLREKSAEIDKKYRSLYKSEEYLALFDKAAKSKGEAQQTAFEAVAKWESDNNVAQLQAHKDEIERQVKAANNAIQDYENAAYERTIEESGLSKANWHRKAAIKEFGYTPFFYDAGYILPNGNMLNFSGEKGKHYGSRGQDHRGISAVFNADSGGEATIEFMSEGNIRLMAETPGVDIISNVEPTTKQYSTIRAFVREYVPTEEFFSIDFTDTKGNTVDSITYEYKVSAEKVVNDIKYYYANGAVPAVSDVQKFRYSVSKADDAAYLDAVNRGDTETAQKMVDDAAKKAGYNVKAYHGSKSTFTVFSEALRGTNQTTEAGKKYFFAGDRETAESYSPYHVLKNLAETMPKMFRMKDADAAKGKGGVMNLYISMNNPLEEDLIDYDWSAHAKKSDALMEYIEQAETNGNDGLIFHHVPDNLMKPGKRISTIYLFKNASQAKSADPITYDDSGNVIPLSKRFDSDKTDIRYSISDSEGKELSEGQQEYFKDSKVRDESGKLSVLYHGTSSYLKIEQFKTTEDYRQGLYLTDNIAVAKNFAKDWRSKDAPEPAMFTKAESDDTSGSHGIYKLYANLTNPFIVDAGNRMYDSIEIPEEMKSTVTNSKLVDTNEIAGYARKSGYDGAIIRNVKESAAILGDDVIVFNPNQVKYTDNLNPTDNPDIRYSVSEDTGAKTIEQLEKENKALRELNDYQRKQFKRSDRKEAEPKAVAKYIKGLLKSYSSKTSFDDIQKKLADLYIYIANGDENGAPGWETAYEQARDIADDILQGSEVLLNGDVLETYSDIKNYFRRKKIFVPAESKTELVDYNNFRNKNFGKFILTTNPAGGGYSVDASYAEMTELFGEGYFPSEITNPTDQLQHISHVLEGMKAIYGNPFSGQAYDEVTAIVSSDILDKFYDIPQAQPTFADKAAKEVTLAKVKGQSKLENLRERKNAQIDKIRQVLRETAAKKMRDLRQNNDDKIAKLKADIRERAVKARANRSKTALRVRIRKSCRQMIKMLAKPDKNRHIPDELQQGAAELFDLIASSPDEIVQTGDMAGTPKTDALKGRLAKVSDLYRRILSENNAPVTLDPDLQVMFDQAKDDLSETPWNKLGAEQLDNLYRLTRAIYKSITTANKAFRDAQNRTYDDLAEAVRVDNAGKNDRAPFSGNALIRGAKKVADDLINFSVVDPRRFFKRLGKTMENLYLNIEHGQDKYIETVTRTVGFMKKTLDGIDATKWDGDGADRIKVGIIIDEFAGTTQEVEFTPAMLIDLYLANKREQSRKHLYGIGGIALQLPGADKPAKPIKINEQQINDILNKHMTADMTRVANAMSEYLTKDMGALANEVSQEMYGYSKFTEQAYWPIDVHRGSVTKSFGEVKGDPTLENSGATKTLVEKAKNALVIKSALDVFDKHTIWAAAYNAYVPALADMRHVLNSKDLDGTTIASLLNDKFGEKAEKYINNFMNLVNSGKLSHGLWNDKISKKLLRNFKAASVGLNASVVVKQPVSYIRAADEINPKYLLQALKLESRKTRRANMAEMLKYNPIARIKDWGFADMGFGKNQRQLYDKSALGMSDKISEVSGLLPSQADKVTWARIWQAVKLEQQAKGINDVGRWAERFREVISSTQVVNTIFTTPPILNEDSALTSMATAFMAEPLKSFNMLRDAISSKNTAQIRRTAAALVTNTFAIAIIDTAFKHLRQKEDEEETTALSLTGEVLLNMLEDTLSMLPYARDTISIFQGYDVERADLTGIDKLWKALASTGNDIVAAVSGGEPRGTAILRLKDVVAGLSVVTGIPAGNIWRDVESILRSYAQYTNNAGLEYLFTATMYNSENDSNRRYYYDLLYKYRDDDKVYEALKKQLIGEHGYRADNIESAILSRWKQSDEYKDAYKTEADRIFETFEGKSWFIKLPDAEQKSIKKQADAFAAGVARDKLDGSYELNDSAQNIKDAVEKGLTPGEYLLYTNARKKADEALDDNGSYGIKEKARAIRELSWMSESKRAALLALDTGKSNEIEALADAGLPLDEFINIYERHAEIGAEEDLSASQQALKFANWLDGRYTAEQADTIQEYFGYWSGAKAVPTYYNNFTDAGMDIDTAYDLADAISKLDPADGKKAVTSLQRYRVVADAEISDKDKLRALSALMPEAGYKALRKAKLQGLKIDSYVKYLEGTAGIVSDVKNGEPISGSRKQKILTYINRMLIPKAHKDLLYYIAGYSENTIGDAPWHGGTPYSGNINGKKVNGRRTRPLKSNSGA